MPMARLVSWFCEEDLASTVNTATDIDMNSFKGANADACWGYLRAPMSRPAML